MKCEATTEKDMREHKVPWLKTMGELTEYIQSLIDIPHDYGTAVYSMSLAGVAAFKFVAGSLGTTGFQASCADLDMIRRTRLIKGPFKIIDFSDMLYPQYRDKFHSQPISKDVWEWLQKIAKENMEKADNEFEDYLVKLGKYKEDISKFVEKYPDYYERKEHYDPLGMGTGDQWEAEEKKKASGFEFAPREPYKPINSDSPVYKHWLSISKGLAPFNCYIETIGGW